MLMFLLSIVICILYVCAFVPSSSFLHKQRQQGINKEHFCFIVYFSIKQKTQVFPLKSSDIITVSHDICRNSQSWFWLLTDEVDKDHMASMNNADHRQVGLALWWTDCQVNTCPISSTQKHSFIMYVWHFLKFSEFYEISSEKKGK